MTETQIAITALLTIGCYTYLYWKDNPIYTIIEHMYVGLSVSYVFANTFHAYIVPAVRDDIMGAGKWSLVLPLILGALIYARYSASLGWLARYPMSFWVGYGAGYVLAYEVPVFVGQVAASFWQLNSLNNVLVALAFLGALIYFVFTVRREIPGVAPAAAFGRWAIIVALGISFGSTALYRFTIFVGRAQLILFDWLKLGG